jgi:hypothetical protein
MDVGERFDLERIKGAAIEAPRGPPSLPRRNARPKQFVGWCDFDESVDRLL